MTNMALETTLADITARLRQGRFSNEASISQGIVLRVLQELGWSTWDTSLVWPEYQTGEGRADFALCHPANHPTVFIEVKPPGRAEDAVRQALDYAFHTGGVQFVVLTDGKTWSFYLTMEQGSYEERRVYKLDLFERPVSEAADTLQRYLAHSRVESGEALSSAREEYRSRNRAGLARQTIPAAWTELVSGGESLLVELVQDAVESKCGVRPEDTDVLEFLQRPLAGPVAAAPNIPSQPAPRQPEPRFTLAPDAPRRLSRPRAGTIKFLGQDVAVRNALEATLYILRQLQARDPSFLKRCAAHPNNFGTTRAYIAQTPEELFPNRPDLRPKHEAIADGWLLNTNLNNGLKVRVVRFSCDVAGLRFGNDIQIDFE